MISEFVQYQLYFPLQMQKAFSFVSMLTFYENLGRVVGGEWWLYADPHSNADFGLKCTSHSQCFFALAGFLCYDFFGYIAAKYGSNDPAFVTSHFDHWSFLLSVIPELQGATMSAEVFLAMYQSTQGLLILRTEKGCADNAKQTA
jgi:hypothetical protein